MCVYKYLCKSCTSKFLTSSISLKETLKEVAREQRHREREFQSKSLLQAVKSSGDKKLSAPVCPWKIDESLIVRTSLNNLALS